MSFMFSFIVKRHWFLFDWNSWWIAIVENVLDA